MNDKIIIRDRGWANIKSCVCVCVCVLGGVKENNKQNKKFKAGWPFSVA